MWVLPSNHNKFSWRNKNSEDPDHTYESILFDLCFLFSHYVLSPGLGVANSLINIESLKLRNENKAKKNKTNHNIYKILTNTLGTE